MGDKVPNCIALFSLEQLDAFPVDTHMSRYLRCNCRDIPRSPRHCAVGGRTGSAGTPVNPRQSCSSTTSPPQPEEFSENPDARAVPSGFEVDGCVMGESSGFGVPHAPVVGHPLP